METLTAKYGDRRTWSITAIYHERSAEEIAVGLPAGMQTPVWRVEWNGRTIDIIEPHSELVGIDVATGEMVDVRGLM